MLKLNILVLLTAIFSLTTGNVLAEVTGEAALQRLVKGNQRFASGTAINPYQDKARRLEVKQSQAPFAAILACADSRVPPEVIFDQGIGNLFVVRVAGNTPDDFLIGSLEYAVGVLKVPLIYVMGHENCGAVAASLQKKVFPGHIESVVQAIRPALHGKTCDKKGKLSCAIQMNVDYVVKKLKASKPILATQVAAGKLKIVGGVYDLKTGIVKP